MANKRYFYVDLLRILLAFVFIFSGFVKAVDPWGLAIKLGEYFDAFGMAWMSGAKYFFSVLISGSELLMGLLLLFNLKLRVASFFTMVFMAFFTILTFVSAIYDPVTDCGCFGDAVTLTNWQTFFKNLVLLPMSVLLFTGSVKKVQRFNMRAEMALVAALAAVAFSIGIYSIIHLPVIEFLPYKLGVNIPAKMAVPEDAPAGEYKTTLIYKEIDTGDIREFEVEDTTWYDSEKWEFVDSRSDEITRGYVPEISDFILFKGDEDFTDLVLEEEEVYLFAFENLSELSARDYEKVMNTVGFASVSGAKVFYMTPSSLAGADPFARRKIYVEGLNVDATTMKTIIRAHKGLVVLSHGTVIAKYNMRDVPDFVSSDAASALGFVIKKGVFRSPGDFLKLLSIILILLTVARVRLCKEY